jgi:hypothetical protein
MDDNDLVYVFDIDNFTFETLLKNIDLLSIDPIEQAAADASWEAHYTELFSTGFT